MTYLILIYRNEESRAVFEWLSDAERRAGLQVYADLNRKLAEAGELAATAALAYADRGRRVAVRGGQLLVHRWPLRRSQSRQRSRSLGSEVLPEAPLEAGR